MVGLAAIATLQSLLKKSPEIAPVILAFTALSFLIILATEILFIWLLLRSKTSAKGAADSSQLKGQSPRELEQGHAQMLPHPAANVTEHTTRTLEPIPRQRKAE